MAHSPLPISEPAGGDINGPASPTRPPPRDAIATTSSTTTATTATVAATLVPDVAQEDLSSKIATLNLCRVCEQQAPKYKCTRCFMPYCSLPCSKQHQATFVHQDIPHDRKPSEDDKENAGPSAADPKDAASGHKHAKSASNDPFAVLVGSKELNRLFERYPRLPGQLDQIYNATQRPSAHVNGSTGTKRPGRVGPGPPARSWTPDVGTAQGVRALQRAKHAGGEDGEAVREYSNLVLTLLLDANDTGAEHAELLERERARESISIIESLLQQEMR